MCGAPLNKFRDPKKYVFEVRGPKWHPLTNSGAAHAFNSLVITKYMAHGSIDYRGRGQTSNDQKLKAKIKKSTLFLEYHKIINR